MNAKQFDALLRLIRLEASPDNRYMPHEILKNAEDEARRLLIDQQATCDCSHCQVRNGRCLQCGKPTGLVGGPR